MPGSRFFTTRHRTGLGTRAAVALLVAAAAAPGAGAQGGAPGLPFAPGERCVYRGSNALGRVGTGTLSVDGPVREGGRATWLLRFDFQGRLGPVAVTDQTTSWFDPAAGASVRYSKRERSPISSSSQDVRMDLAANRWSGQDGAGGPMPTSAPLDELSFLYHVRTLRLRDGDTYRVTRHYEPGRNPVTVRVIGRGRVRVPAGEFQTIEVELRVRDPNRYGGEGIIQLHLTDDAKRLLVRMESSVPRAGRVVLSLQSGTGGCAAAGSVSSR
jgi:hypothetical protein